MADFRRYYIPNALVFITAVTEKRRRLLTGETVELFWKISRNTQAIIPFKLLAYCVLPDHFHWIMRMPESTPIFSIVIHSVKRNFTLEYKKKNNIAVPMKLWQPRFYDHVIRDQQDLENHFHYIHFNPVKHGYVDYPEQWDASSFRFWVQNGLYPENWRLENEPLTRHGFGE